MKRTVCHIRKGAKTYCGKRIGPDVGMVPPHRVSVGLSVAEILASPSETGCKGCEKSARKARTARLRGLIATPYATPQMVANADYAERVGKSNIDGGW